MLTILKMHVDCQTVALLVNSQVSPVYQCIAHNKLIRSSTIGNIHSVESSTCWVEEHFQR